MQERKNYDSAFCGNLPLHQINLIQPYGALIVLDKGYEIIQVSENIQEVTGLIPSAIINSSISKHIPPLQFDQLVNSIGKLLKRIPARFTFQTPGGKFDVTGIIHTKEMQILLELELTHFSGGTVPEDFVNVYHELKVSMAAIEQASTLEEVWHTSAAEIKKLSGFDKVMIYQFDKDWNGKVVAEEMEAGMESYLGLVFPASDIPRQARALYINNPYRLIPDRNYKPVKLYPLINPLTDGFLDLSDLNVRGVAAVHLEYMKHMGITASMSTRILNSDNSLWGLISCHHLSPKPMSQGFCTIFELLSTIIASRIIALEDRQNIREFSAMQQTERSLIKQVYSEDDLAAGLLKMDLNVLQLFNADGASFMFNRKLECIGETPSRDEIHELAFWLGSLQINKVYSEENLSAVYDRALDFAKAASGILVIPLRPAREEYLILYRQEVIQKIDWGGNPSEAIQFEKNKLNYHPRNSFGIWQETVANTSLPWKSYELEMAEQVRNFLLDYLIQKNKD